ncbi:MAG TPA: TIR domain-containing protein [Candidatus Tectomicrobia bacterium]|nr:TIR domain-containing protein [Candidatus Tectomicrobia bacterium]
MPGMDNAHALVVGIANYQHINNLPPTVLKDAQDVYTLLVDSQSCGYPTDHVELLLDKQATQSAIRQALAELAQHGNPDATVFFYLSSHGGRLESGRYAGEYLLPVDTLYTSDQSLAQTAISGAEFTTALQAIPARKVVVVFDCCHAGGIGQPKEATVPQLKALPESYYEALTSGRGRVILASSRSSESSYILPGAANSLFTQYLLAGLRGGAPGPGGVIRIFDLFHYLQPRVTSDQPNQHPIFKAELEENFPIAMYLGGKTPAPMPSPPPADHFAYDVFISYRQQEPDRSWVRKTLQPRLEAQGLRACIDYRDFRLGAPLVLEMARAVEQSRYTLAVLSPAYLTSNFTELENVLAEHLGLETSQRRLLAIMREPCTPRLGMRARLWLDMTDDGELERNVERLVYELRQTPDK